MKIRIKYIKKLIVSFLFLSIMGGIVVNATFFIHTHRSAGGQVVFHAHPFNKTSEAKDPDTQHQHTKIELQVIQSLDYFVFADSNVDDFKSTFFLISKYNIPECFIKSSHLNILKNYRAPPFFI
jgi:hypothetical protein